MKIKLKEGMRFIANDNSDSFILKKWHFYGDEQTWCAFDEKDSLIYPLSELAIEEYSPVIGSKIINEKNEYVE